MKRAFKLFVLFPLILFTCSVSAQTISSRKQDTSKQDSQHVRTKTIVLHMTITDNTPEEMEKFDASVKKKHQSHSGCTRFSNGGLYQ